ILRVGKDSVASFIAGPRKPDGTKDPVAKDKTLDQAMREYLTAITSRPARPGRRGAATAPATAPAAATQTGDPPRFAAGQFPNRFDAVMDNLFYRLEPPAEKQ